MSEELRKHGGEGIRRCFRVRQSRGVFCGEAGAGLDGLPRADGRRSHCGRGNGSFEAATFEALADVELDVQGMMCQKNCGSTVKAAIEHVVGVERVEVSFA